MQPKTRKRLIIAAWVFGSLLVGIVIFTPCLDCVGNSRMYANQASAVGTIGHLTQAEFKFADSHHGFSCQLEQLRPILKEGDWGEGPPDFYVDGIRSGYIFSITGCDKDVSIAATHYRITATPRFPGQSGQYAYCSDEARIIWFDESGDAAKCLANRKTVDQPIR